MILLMDRFARVGMAVGICFIFQPWWSEGFRYGFFTTAAFTLLHIITSHVDLSGKAGSNDRAQDSGESRSQRVE